MENAVFNANWSLDHLLSKTINDLNEMWNWQKKLVNIRKENHIWEMSRERIEVDEEDFSHAESIFDNYTDKEFETDRDKCFE